MATTGKGCKGRNKRGEPCSAPQLEGSEWCYFHDPSRREERAAARRAGGKARHGRPIGRRDDGGGSVTFRTIGDCLSLLEQEATELLTLERSVNRTRALVSLVSEAGRLIVNHELEQRLDILEKSAYGKRTV